jgi:ribonuclease HI
MKNNIEALGKAMKEITKGHKSIVYTVYDSALVEIYINFQGINAQKEAKACSANWWRSINDHLKAKEKFYYEVAVTWVNHYGEVMKETSSSHNFPHKAGYMPHQITDPEPPKGALRQI